MKMETTVTANAEGEVEAVQLKPGIMVYADDLVVKLK
jgi:pyruvate carboxylase